MIYSYIQTESGKEQASLSVGGSAHDFLNKTLNVDCTVSLPHF